MATAPRSNAIFLFAGSGGKSAGYRDHFLPDGSYRYTGEGQSGDQVFTHSNRALRDHQLNGVDVLLFEKVGTTPIVTFLGEFACAGWEYETQLGADKAPRQAIVFTLLPIEALTADGSAGAAAEFLSAAELRGRAYAAAAPAPKTGTAAPRTIYQRSADVRDWVLARADGYCEACGEPAPFSTAGGAPYLEAHHIDRLSDGGPDCPTRVAGICPNCHRRAHYGVDAPALNGGLRVKIAELEASLGEAPPHSGT